MNSAGSILRSKRSIFEMKDWGLPSRTASAACVTPFSRRSWARRSTKARYAGSWSVDVIGLPLAKGGNPVRTRFGITHIGFVGVAMRSVGAYVLVVGAALAGCVSEAESARRAEAALIQEAQAAVSSELRDPTSPLFSQVRTRDSLVCGMVNARNGFGAYAGKQRFTYQSGRAVIDPSLRPPHEGPLEMVRQTEICMFDLDYRTCDGAEGLPSAVERCMTGTQMVTPGQEVTEGAAKQACLTALERRFNEDIRPAKLTSGTSRARKISTGWRVSVEWTASGPETSVGGATGTCLVHDDGMTKVEALVEG